MIAKLGIQCSIYSTNNTKQYDKYLKCKKTSIVLCTGPAGTGKTMLACKYAIDELNDRRYNKMVITRPNVSVDEDMGYLPGDTLQKMHPWMLPIYDQLEKFSNRAIIVKYIKDNTIEVIPLGFMRGRTFDDTVLLADEMQNSTCKQMLNLLTRVGKNSKLIITGDLLQCDIEDTNNGLQELIKKLETYENQLQGICHAELTEEDVKRSEIVKLILKIYS